MQDMINNADIYLYITEWIKIYGQDLMDLLLPIKDNTSSDSKIRYGKNFTKEFREHISSWFFSGQMGVLQPLLLINIDNMSKSTDCFQKYIICISYRISPITLHANINNTPYELERRFDIVSRLIQCMFVGYDKETGKKRTLWKDMNNIQDFPKRINGRLLYKQPDRQYEVKDEIYGKTWCFVIEIENKHCGDSAYKQEC